MTIMTTTFIPCGAKQPFIAMIAGAIFGGSSVDCNRRLLLRYGGYHRVLVSFLRKTKMFAGDPAPFVMELPRIPYSYSWKRTADSMWERGWSFIKKAGTIILLSTIVVWFTTYFGWVDGAFTDA